MTQKKWYRSKTVWLNIILIVLDAINQIAQFVPVPPGVLSGIGIIGVCLRAITKEKLFI